MYDILIKNGTVVDGTGNAGFQADVAVKDGKIEAVGPSLSGEAKEVIDAAGLIVAPGFIDWHSHSDLTVLMNFDAANILEQGITLEIAGHCGVSVAPLGEGKVANIGYYAKPEQTEAMTAAGGGYAAFLEEVKKLELPTNITAFVGHGNIRASVIGFEGRAPSESEMAAMKAALDEAMEAGALGLSSGLIYPPGSYSTDEELIELAKESAKYEGAMYATHMRNEGDRVVESVEATLRLGREAGIPVAISHHKVAGQHNKGKSVETLRLMDEAKAAGQVVYLDAYPYDGGSTSLMSSIPPKFAVGGPEALIEKLQDPAIRAEMTALLKEPGADFENLIYGSGLDHVIVASEVKTEINGKTLLQLAEESGKDPYDCLYDLLVETKGEVGAVYRMICPWDMENILKYKDTMAGIDGAQSPAREQFDHPRGGATYPRLIGTFCRDKGFYTLEDCIHRFTGKAAAAVGFAQKGILSVGKDADLVIFNFDTISGNADYDCADLPNEGIEYVFVNGVKAVEGGKITGAKGGKVLLRGGLDA